MKANKWKVHCNVNHEQQVYFFVTLKPEIILIINLIPDNT